MRGLVHLPEIERRVIDFEIDFKLINSFLMSKYNVDFYNAMKLPEIDFDSFFEDMSDTLLGDVINVRLKKKNNEKMTKEEKLFYEKVKLPFTEEEKKLIEEIDKDLEKQNQNILKAFKNINVDSSKVEINKKENYKLSDFSEFGGDE